jgi:hypothetical protein
MAKGKISETLDPQSIDQVLLLIKKLNELLPFLLSLKQNERMGLVKLGPKSIKFVESVLTVAEQHPELVPPAFDVVEMRKDYDLVKRLEQIQPSLQMLAQATDDTRTVAGSEAITTALALYGVFKAAKRSVPGIESVLAEMGGRFKKRARTPKAV